MRYRPRCHLELIGDAAPGSGRAQDAVTTPGCVAEPVTREGPGSWTHPHLSRMLYADGKVVTPLYRAKPGETRIDRGTGEIRAVRHEPDARLHFEGDGEAAWGTKFVIVAVRGEETHARMILDVERVPEPGGEAWSR